MEVINKKHDDIYVNERVKLEAFINITNTSYIYFSSGATRRFGLVEGLKINFINDEGIWLFYCSDDTDGFELKSKDNNATIICNAALIQLFLKRTRHTIPCKFNLKLTNAKHEGNFLIKIETNKPL